MADIVENAHFVADIVVDSSCCGKRKSVVYGIVGMVGFYFEVVDLLSDYLFLMTMQKYIDDQNDDAHIIESYIPAFYISVVLPWIVIFLSSTLKYYGRTASRSETTVLTTSWNCKTRLKKEEHIVPDRDKAIESGFVMFSSIFFDNFILRILEAVTFSRYDPRKHAIFPVEEMESMRNLTIAILEDIPQFALKLGLFSVLNENGRKDLNINGGMWTFTISFITTILNLVKVIVVEFSKRKEYPTLSICSYMGHVFSFIHPNDEYIVAIADNVKNRSYSSTVLHLMGGCITDAGMNTLAEAIDESSLLEMKDESEVFFIQRPPLTLRRINLGWNSFGDEGVFALSKALKSYDGIKVLDLRGCEGIREQGYENLKELLIQHNTLHTLILSNTEDAETETGTTIGGGVTKSWADDISSNQSGKNICFEDLGNNKFDRWIRRIERQSR